MWLNQTFFCFLSENIHKITATRKTIVERTIIRILIFSLWVLIAILAKQNIIISRSSSKMAIFSGFDASTFFLFFSSFWFPVAHEDESAFFDFVREDMINTPFLFYQHGGVEMKKWKFCSSLSFILTGLILTIVLCHKQDHSYMIIFPQLLIFIGIALHLKITHQDYESAFKEIIRFLVYSAVFLIAILLLIQIYFSKEALLIFIFIIFSGFFLFASIRYFANVCYTLLKSIRQAAATKNQKAEFVMWVVTFLSSVATIISLLIALPEFMIHEI